MRNFERVIYCTDDEETAWKRYNRSRRIASEPVYETPDYDPEKGYRDILGGWHKTKKERDYYDSIGY